MAFILSYKRHDLFLNNCKMAEGNDWNFSQGRVRALIDGKEYFECRREEDHGSVPPPVGRVGITPRNWVGTHGNLGRTDTCGRWKEGQIP